MENEARIIRKMPNPFNEKGEMRTVGVEFEFAGIGLEQTSEFVHETYGGRIDRESTFAHKIKDSTVGDFSIEIDSGVLKDKRYLTALEGLGLTPSFTQSDTLEQWLLSAFATVVPYELVTPPLPIDKMDVFDDIREGLRQRGALGTKASILYGFGFHINIETPSLSPTVIQRYMQAFLLLYPWIVKTIHVDFTRGVLPFITPFPKEYVELILSSEYGTSGATFIDDYLRYNPTRNRPLDLLPLLASVDKEKVDQYLGKDECGSPRPTFHFRMPNCLIDEEEWSVEKEWQVWLAVEELADNPQRLRTLISELKPEKHTMLETIGDTLSGGAGIEPEIA